MVLESNRFNCFGFEKHIISIILKVVRIFHKNTTYNQQLFVLIVRIVLLTKLKRYFIPYFR